jgi:molybdopterin molybdotransferase/putative molybdopterin biosynthesis protein
MEFDRITRDEILQKLSALWAPAPLIEIVPTRQAGGRITARELYSQNTIPVKRASSADGYAVRSAAFAGGPPDTSDWREGVDYERADTGDDFDDAFDAVARIEDISFDERGKIHFAEGLKVTKDLNVNGRGKMVSESDLIIEERTPIRCLDVASLTMGGYTEVPVYKKPVVTFIPTGNELVPAGQKPQRGQNVDTNSVLVEGMLIELGAEPICAPIVKDAPALLEAALDEAIRNSDIVIINGGSSKGQDDYNARLLKSKGALICHGMAAAPGRPMCVAIVDGKPVINIPGPMLATFYCVDWCVRALVGRYYGIPVPARRRTVPAKLAADLKTPPGMELFYKLVITEGPEGYIAQPTAFFDTPGPRVAGFSNGRFISELGKSLYPKGSVIDVELLRDPEFIKKDIKKD